MAVAPERRRARRVALPIAALAIAAVASGCKGQLAVSAQSPVTPSAAAAPGSTAPVAADPASASPSTSAAATASAAGQPPATGALSVSVTSPVTLSGSVAVPVTCVTGRGYRASVATGVIHGDQVSYTVAIAPYRGPGSYPAVVAVTLRQSSGAVTTIAGVSRVPASITAIGGSFSVSATGSAGRTFTGSLTWTCGT